MFVPVAQSYKDSNFCHVKDNHEKLKISVFIMNLKKECLTLKYKNGILKIKYCDIFNNIISEHSSFLQIIQIDSDIYDIERAHSYLDKYSLTIIIPKKKIVSDSSVTIKINS